MFAKIFNSPALVRVVPFALFILLTSMQERFGDTGRYWVYAGKTFLGAVMLLAIWRYIEEMEWRFSWEAVAVGVGVWIIWVGLDGYYPKTGTLYAEHICPWLQKIGLTKSCTAAPVAPWNPNEAFGPASGLALFFIVVRIVGSSLVVPPLEEVFYRSFVYRYIASQEFMAVSLGKFLPIPFLVTSVLFGFVHHEWLAGILCGFAYQGLVIWKGRLGDAIVAHGITNFLLGLWVVWKGAWHFW